MVWQVLPFLLRPVKDPPAVSPAPHIFNQLAAVMAGHGERMAADVQGTSALATMLNLAAKRALDELTLRKMIEYDLPQIMAKHQQALQEAQQRHEINRIMAVSQQLPALFTMAGLGGGGGGFQVRDAAGRVTTSVGGGGTRSGQSALAFGKHAWVPSGRGYLVRARLPRARYNPVSGWQFRPWGS